MATYILKRKSYSVNPYKVTLSDLSIEFGIKFPEEIKKLSKMERRIEAELHYWASTAPGINMVASPEMMYQVLSQGGTIIPALVDSQGQVTLSYDINTGFYVYGDTQLKDPSSFMNIVISEIDKAMSQYQSMSENPEATGGDIEVIKQDLTYYQTYKDNVMMAFGINPNPQPSGEQ